MPITSKMTISNRHTSPSDTRPLLPSQTPQSGDAPSYGATDPHVLETGTRQDGDTSGSVTPVSTSGGADGTAVEGAKVEKVNKKFREIWPLCLGLWTAVFCSALGATVVANLQIEIGSYFNAGSLAAWLGTAYLLGLTAMTPLYGRLAQVMGRKGCMMLALSLFFSGTTLCAVAPSMKLILVARCIAGAGSGGLLTVTAIIISDLVSIADRGLYQSGVNLLFGAGAASGAFVGGAIADQYGWRMAFWVQLPPILIATFLVITQVHVPHVKGDLTAWERFKRIDWLGSLFLVVSISSLSFASSLMTASGYPFRHPLVWGLYLTCVVSLPIFAWVENRAAEPILPMTFLTRLQPSLVLFGLFLCTCATFSRLYMQPVYLHVTRGLNGTQVGTLLLPSSIVGSAASLHAGWHMRHFKEYKKLQTLFSIIPWLQAISILVSWNISTNIHRLWIEMAVAAVGGGCIITTLLTALIACVDPSEMSLAVSACYLFRAVGQVIGVALAAAIQQSVLASQLATRLQGYPGDLIRSIIQDPAGVVETLEPWVKMQAKLAYLGSIQAVFGFVILVGVLLTTVSLSIRAFPLT